MRLDLPDQEWDDKETVRIQENYCGYQILSVRSVAIQVEGRRCGERRDLARLNRRRLGSEAVRVATVAEGLLLVPLGGQSGSLFDWGWRGTSGTIP